MNRRGWLVVYWTLFIAILGTAALNMLHVRGGFLTNHAADLVVPAWLYVASRGLHARNGRQTFVQRTLGQTPERAAIVLFLASTLTEVSQFYWPRGLFPGRFDALDVLAYAVGLAIGYVMDKRSLSKAERVPVEDREPVA